MSDQIQAAEILALTAAIDGDEIELDSSVLLGALLKGTAKAVMLGEFRYQVSRLRAVARELRGRVITSCWLDTSTTKSRGSWVTPADGDAFGYGWLPIETRKKKIRPRGARLCFRWNRAGIDLIPDLWRAPSEQETVCVVFPIHP